MDGFDAAAVHQDEAGKRVVAGQHERGGAGLGEMARAGDDRFEIEAVEQRAVDVAGEVGGEIEQAAHGGRAGARFAAQAAEDRERAALRVEEHVGIVHSSVRHFEILNGLIMPLKIKRAAIENADGGVVAELMIAIEPDATFNLHPSVRHRPACFVQRKEVAIGFAVVVQRAGEGVVGAAVELNHAGVLGIQPDIAHAGDGPGNIRACGALVVIAEQRHRQLVPVQVEGAAEIKSVGLAGDQTVAAIADLEPRVAFEHERTVQRDAGGLGIKIHRADEHRAAQMQRVAVERVEDGAGGAAEDDQSRTQSHEVVHHGDGDGHGTDLWKTQRLVILRRAGRGPVVRRAPKFVAAAPGPDPFSRLGRRQHPQQGKQSSDSFHLLW